MTRAYQEIYLSKAQSVIGDAFDYTVNTCAILGTDFVKLFIASSVSKRIENGEPVYLAGKSGIEIVREIVAETKGQELQIEPQEHFGRSKEYCTQKRLAQRAAGETSITWANQPKAFQLKVMAAVSTGMAAITSAAPAMKP